MIGSLGNIVFYVNDFNVFSLKKELTRSRRVKITEHNPIYGIKTIRQQGRDLVELKISIELIKPLSKSPGYQMQLIKEFMELGLYAHLVIGLHVMGEFPFIITECNETLSYFNNMSGDFDYINLEITLLEYVDNPKYYQNKLRYMKREKVLFEELSKTEVMSEQKKVVE